MDDVRLAELQAEVAEKALSYTVRAYIAGLEERVGDGVNRETALVLTITDLLRLARVYARIRVDEENLAPLPTEHQLDAVTRAERLLASRTPPVVLNAADATWTAANPQLLEDPDGER